MKLTANNDILLTLGLAGGVVGLLYFLHKDYEKRRLNTRVIAEGAFDSAEYKTRHATRPDWSGGQYRDKPKKENITVIRFTDGSSVVVDGYIDIAYAKGTKISVEENGLGERTVCMALP
jgi:hypothetical protein